MSDASPLALEASGVGGGQVPKAIDDFIDVSLGKSGRTESMGHRDGSAGGGVNAVCLPAAGRCKPIAGEGQ